MSCTAILVPSGAFGLSVRQSKYTAMLASTKTLKVRSPHGNFQGLEHRVCSDPVLKFISFLALEEKPAEESENL
jgi:hypothetical protein